MKSIILSLVFIFSSLLSNAQDGITGSWHGLLKTPMGELRISIHIDRSDTGYIAKMDSPDQHAFGLPITSIQFHVPNITFQINNMLIKYIGKLIDDKMIEGVFTQGGASFDLHFYRKEIAANVKRRPQEPKPPFPYRSEEVRFKNRGAGISLSGTLTIPESNGVSKRYPAVVLVSGSGKQNRDEELLGHKPFLVISDYLTKHGIAVLRYDDRGVAGSEGNFETATSLDFANDAESAVEYLICRDDIDHSRIGIIGHSEGGIIAPIVANKIREIKCIVLLAAPGVTGFEILLLQQELIGATSGLSSQEVQRGVSLNKGAFDIIIRYGDDTTGLDNDLRSYLNSRLNNAESSAINMMVAQLTSPWFRFFLSYNPIPALEMLSCSVLAINGERDVQVPYKIDLDAIEKALIKGGNRDYTIKSFPELNHLFQRCNTGSVNEYAEIEETFSPEVLKYITEWLQKSL